MQETSRAECLEATNPWALTSIKKYYMGNSITNSTSNSTSTSGAAALGTAALTTLLLVL